MKYLAFTPEGVLYARYDSEINGANIPLDATEVTEELFFRTILEKDGVWRLDAGVIRKVDSAPRPVELVRVERWSAVKAVRDSRCAEGGYKVSGKWFHSDSQSRIQQLGLVLLGASIPAGTLWKTMDGSFVAMTSTLAQQILAAAAASDAANFAAAEAHKAAIFTSSDPESYDFSGGWPPQFDG